MEDPIPSNWAPVELLEIHTCDVHDLHIGVDGDAIDDGGKEVQPLQMGAVKKISTPSGGNGTNMPGTTVGRMLMSSDTSC